MAAQRGIQAVLWMFLVIVSSHLQAETVSTLEQQKSISLTVYNQDLALIRDVRRIGLQKGVNTVAIREVSGRIRPETTIITSLSHPDSLQLLEQNFDFDLLTPSQLLEKYVGKQVRIVRVHPTTGAESVEQATVLSANNGVVLKIGDRIETGIPGRLVFDEVPANLRDRPTLSIKTHSPISVQQDIALSYLSAGFAWQADYVAKLSADETRIDLNGWVTVNNQSGASYHNASLQLVAGDINRAQRPEAYLEMMQESQVRKASADAALQQESLFEYHLYTLPRPTDILQNQTKQIALLNAGQIPIHKEFLLRGQPHYYYNAHADLGSKLKVGVFVEFLNDKKSALGKPMPSGVVRVYKDDSRGNLQFIGEDAIDHTPEDEKIRLKLGDAFDVTANKKQTLYKKENAYGKYSYAASSAYEIELHNAKDEAVTVRVIEPVPGDWKLTQSSHAHEKVSAGLLEWNISVPAKQRVTLAYEVLVRN